MGLTVEDQFEAPVISLRPVRPRRRARKLLVLAVVLGVAVAAIAGAGTWFAHYQPLDVSFVQGIGVDQAEFSNVYVANYVDGGMVGIGYLLRNTGSMAIRIDKMAIDLPPMSTVKVDRVWLNDPRGSFYGLDQPGPPAFPHTLKPHDFMIVFVRYRIGECENSPPGSRQAYWGPMRFTTHVLGMTRDIALSMPPIGVRIPDAYRCPRPRPTSPAP